MLPQFQQMPEGQLLVAAALCGSCSEGLGLGAQTRSPMAKRLHESPAGLGSKAPAQKAARSPNSWPRSLAAQQTRSERGKTSVRRAEGGG
mmetsp:Transcript_78394/g.197840  ORF Transcript_78394/g.197840 Transcript_78394/m.197840 type:complete len:90 (-) Transcript_78394:41-310(-)